MDYLQHVLVLHVVAKAVSDTMGPSKPTATWPVMNVLADPLMG